MVDTKNLVIGSGPAGLTAAIYLARADLKPIVLEGPEPGGQLMWTTDVENYPGFPDGILGPELMQAFRQQAIRFGSVLKPESVSKVDFSTTPYTVQTDREQYRADTLIIATGASAKWLNLPNEQRLRGKGVSACATCDGFFFRNKVVAVVGGGDSAMEESLYLTKFATHVHVLVRSINLRASQIMIHRARSNPKIEFHWETEVVDVLGSDRVVGLKLVSGPQKKEWTLDAQGLFLAIGHQPNTHFFTPFLPVEKQGYLSVIDAVKTKLPGVFVAGDAADWRYRQAVTAAGAGTMAALETERFLHDKIAPD